MYIGLIAQPERKSWTDSSKQLAILASHGIYRTGYTIVSGRYRIEVLRGKRNKLIHTAFGFTFLCLLLRGAWLLPNVQC